MPKNTTTDGRYTTYSTPFYSITVDNTTGKIVNRKRKKKTASLENLYEKTVPDSIKRKIEAYSGETSADVEKQNLELAKEQYEYSQGIQERVFEREDTAIQRRVADLKAAGMSPILAAGQGAQAGPVVSTKAPARGTVDYSGIGTMAQMAMNFMKMDADITKTKADTENIIQQKKKNKVETETKERDLQLSKQSGMVSSPGTVGRTIRDIGNILQSAMRQLFTPDKKIVPKKKSVPKINLNKYRYNR